MTVAGGTPPGPRWRRSRIRKRPGGAGRWCGSSRTRTRRATRASRFWKSDAADVTDAASRGPPYLLGRDAVACSRLPGQVTALFPHKMVTISHKAVIIPHKTVTISHETVVIPHKEVTIPHKNVVAHAPA